MGQFSDEGARRIVEATKRVEAGYRGGGIGPRSAYPRAIASAVGSVAKTYAGGIPQRTANIPGKALVALYKLNPTTEKLIYWKDISSYHIFSTAAAGYTWGAVIYLDGTPYFLAEDCGGSPDSTTYLS